MQTTTVGFRAGRGGIPYQEDMGFSLPDDESGEDHIAVLIALQGPGGFDTDEGLYREVGLGTTIWSPLASGVLTGKYNDGIPDDTRMALKDYGWLRKMLESEEGQQRIAKVRELSKIADGLGVPMAHLALAWVLKNPNVSTVITGASKVPAVEQNMKALDVVEQLTDDVMESIEEILDNKPRIPRF